jgi:hypothetical protein
LTATHCFFENRILQTAMAALPGCFLKYGRFFSPGGQIKTFNLMLAALDSGDLSIFHRKPLLSQRM